MTSFKFFTFFYIFFCFILEIQAQVLTIPKNAEELNLDSYFSIFNDSSEKYTVQQVISKPFLFTEKANKNFTVSKAKSFWIKVSILNQSNCLEWIANFDHKEVILYDSLGNQLAKTGHGFPFSERFFGHTFGHRIFLPISLPSNIQKTFFIQVKTSDIFILSPENMLVPVLKSYAKIAETYRWFTVGNIATIAILFALGIYHFIIYILTKDKNYFYFSLFSISMVFFVAFFKGYLLELFLTNSPNFYYEYVYKLVSTLFDLSYLWFVVKYLETKKRHPKWHIFLQTMVYLFVLLRFLPSSEFIKYLNNIRLQVTLFLYFVLGFWAWYKQNPFAIFFILADSVFLLGIIANIALDIFKISNDIFNFGDIGLILQQIFFAVGLATKINILNKEKQETQKLFVLQLEENQRIKDQINEELERKVKERTLEIKEKQIKIGEYNEELLQMNEEMKQTNEEIRSTLEFAENQTKIITNKNKHLTDSINYALRIQTALLPTEDEIQKHFPEMFILNKPKDIVSGDFYWFEDKKDVQILAVADCTGHGVPGALMSMLGVEILDKIVNEHHILDVRWILYALNIEIRKVLKSEQTKTHDGMDICIVSVDRKHGILEYAGAMNPFFFIQNHVFNQIRANKYPIGGRIMKEKQEREYEKHTIMFEKEDHFVFYLCSDGYQDQFGGEKGGKFMVKKLKELLFEIHEKELFEQKLILDSTFDLWKNNEEQVDDVLIMGIKI